MKHINIGILAHVDAGKTTLSEALLYIAGSIRKLGRVDNRDAFLDTYELERARGITIFSKQAELEFGDASITLLDTPGHSDFSAEMERTLQVLDYAVLVISGADGVQGHTATLWNLLEKYRIPVFIFINKMDQNGVSKENLMNEIHTKLSTGCVDFTSDNADTYETFFENIALCDEEALNRFMEKNIIGETEIIRLVAERKVYPCYFGAALRMEGVEQLLEGVCRYTCEKTLPDEFGAKVYKIARDEQGNRLTFMKLTGGSLCVKAQISESMKVNQIRIYSGEKFKAVNEAKKGMLCAVTGLINTYPGQGFGIESDSEKPMIVPVLTYKIVLPTGCEPAVILPKLRQLEEEEPELHISWDEKLQEIQVQIMGEIQIEILKSLIMERFGVEVGFGEGNILYKETITDSVEGVGHFEPLRHYAEVHLLIEPGETGSGIVISADCSEDILDRNWQNLVLSHLAEKEHPGVLIGAPLTDARITLVSGRAHQKHTEGGDFRQAAFRALRNGLMQAESILLEPFYDFVLEIPENMVGRAINDIEKMKGKFTLGEAKDGIMIINGSAPVINMRSYQSDVIAYTKGFGRLFCSFGGYGICHNAEEIIGSSGYDADRDVNNPSGSVFCANGTGFTVSWENVKDYMHIPYLKKQVESEKEAEVSRRSIVDEWIDDDEVDSIIRQTYYANSREKKGERKHFSARKPSREFSSIRSFGSPGTPKEKYLLVDGYNIIFAWDELKALAAVGIDAARGRLLDMMSNYQGIRKCNLIVVFDAYKIKGHETEEIKHDNINIVYTAEDQTADQYIERFAYLNSEKYSITVATSDALEQSVTRSKGCVIISAREFEEEIKSATEMIMQEFRDKQQPYRNIIGDKITKIGD